MDLSDLLPIGFTFKRAELKILYEDSLCRFKRAWGDSTSSLFADILRHTDSSVYRDWLPCTVQGKIIVGS